MRRCSVSVSRETSAPSRIASWIEVRRESGAVPRCAAVNAAYKVACRCRCRCRCWCWCWCPSWCWCWSPLASSPCEGSSTGTRRQVGQSLDPDAGYPTASGTSSSEPRCVDHRFTRNVYPVSVILRGGRRAGCCLRVSHRRCRAARARRRDRDRHPKSHPRQPFHVKRRQEFAINVWLALSMAEQCGIISLLLLDRFVGTVAVEKSSYLQRKAYSAFWSGTAARSSEHPEAAPPRRRLLLVATGASQLAVAWPGCVGTPVPVATHIGGRFT